MLRTVRYRFLQERGGVAFASCVALHVLVAAVLFTLVGCTDSKAERPRDRDAGRPGQRGERPYRPPIPVAVEPA